MIKACLRYPFSNDEEEAVIRNIVLALHNADSDYEGRIYYDNIRYIDAENLDDIDAEFFVMPIEEIHFDYVNGYPCQDVLDILEFKRQRNLPKDKEPIKKIEEYLNLKKR